MGNFANPVQYLFGELCTKLFLFSDDNRVMKVKEGYMISDAVQVFDEVLLFLNFL